MRILKDPEVRRNEIMDAAARLFSAKGYQETTIIDILSEIGVAKGTFYYHFASKEAVLDGIIDRIIARDVAEAEQIVADPSRPVFEKLFQVLLKQKPKEDGDKAQMMRQIHKPSNAELHQKTLVRSIEAMTPILASIVEQGIREGIMETAYPLETMEFLVAAGQTIFDTGLFQWEPEAARRKAAAFVHLMELSLGAPNGSFDYMTELLTEKAEPQ